MHSAVLHPISSNFLLFMTLLGEVSFRLLRMVGIQERISVTPTTMTTISSKSICFPKPDRANLSLLSYGYFIYAAAIIGYLDPAWLPANTPYVNALVRDIANPTDSDPFFPVSRNFDWYHGHSWAHGLFETLDGKDEESSSEDSMSAYAIKMWGRTIGDSNMEARGNLQLAVTARSLQNYFLYASDNTIEPANFIGNKVSGIMFENKIDHTTYFGANPEFVQGIHMIPLLPSSTLTRTTTFVQEEWDAYFSNGRADAVTGGWKGVLFANLAIVDAKTSWDFFGRAGFDASWLDGGASRTWYLALAAGEVFSLPLFFSFGLLKRDLS